MVKVNIVFNIIDNIKTKYFFFLKILNKNNFLFKLGDILLGFFKIKNKYIFSKSIIVKLKNFFNKNMFFIKYFINAVILLNNKLNLFGTRVFNFFFFLKTIKFLKIKYLIFKNI